MTISHGRRVTGWVAAALGAALLGWAGTPLGLALRNPPPPAADELLLPVLGSLAGIVLIAAGVARAAGRPRR